MNRARPVAAAVTGLVGALAIAFGIPTGTIAVAQIGGCATNPAAWGCAWDEGYEDGMTFTGDEVVLAGVFRPPAGTTVESVAAAAYPQFSDADCSVDEGLVSVTTTTTSSSSSTATTPTTTVSDGSVHFAVPLQPRCNGLYEMQVRARLAGSGQQSPVIALADVHVALRPRPAVGPLTVEHRPGEGEFVQWSPPAYTTEEGGPPPDFAGYRLERAIGAGAYEELAVLPADATTHADASVAAPTTPGTYRYRVHTLRLDAPEEEASALVASAPELAPVGSFTIEPPETTSTTARPPLNPIDPNARGGGGSGGASRPSTLPRGGGVPLGETVQPDTGFQDTLDYSDFEFGTEEAVPPADADAFLELDEEGSQEAPGEGLVEPIAVGSCLAMWAFHLRYLSRRADQLA